MNKIKHFKFFYGEVNIDLERHNVLMFGETLNTKTQQC